MRNKLNNMPYKPDYKYIPPFAWPVLTPRYDFLLLITGLGPRFKSKVLNSVSLRDGMIVADIGCGTGVFLKIAKQKYPNASFIGIDPDEQALGIAERRFAKAGLSIELKKAFAESLPLDDQSVDVCFSSLAFHHMPDTIKNLAIKEIYRVLKTGGRVVIADFGERSRTLLRKTLFFENLEYIDGNFKGLVPKYLQEENFKNIKVVNHHFPSIDIIVAEK